jgi:capsular exopolysaccharide synthesis family protein
MRGQKSFSAFSEAFRLLLTSILFIGRRRPIQVVVVTSPGPSEGKSTVASNLALAFAETGRTALVIDCDMVRPRQHEILAVPNESGLGDLLAASEPLDARSVMTAIREGQMPGVSVMPFGAPETGASANLLHSRRFPELIALARERFDIILIDTPPMLYMADSRIVGSLADGVMLVVRARQTQRDAAMKAGRQLTADGVPVLGVALNDWNPRLDGYYSAYDYSKYYETNR